MRAGEVEARRPIRLTAARICRTPSCGAGSSCAFASFNIETLLEAVVEIGWTRHAQIRDAGSVPEQARS